MTTPPTMASRAGRRFVHALIVIGEAIMLYCGISVIASSEADVLANLAVWDLVAFTYLGIGAFVMRRRALSPSREVGPAPTHGRAMSSVISLYWGMLPALFSALGLTAAVSVLLGLDDGAGHDLALAAQGAAALVMVSGWLMLHASYARRYHWFYQHDGGGLEFADTPQPSDVDFLYFSMTIGSSFATSDVNVTTSRMRWHVLVHSVMSFFYNAVVLAVGFRILTGG